MASECSLRGGWLCQHLLEHQKTLFNGGWAVLDILCYRYTLYLQFTGDQHLLQKFKILNWSHKSFFHFCLLCCRGFHNTLGSDNEMYYFGQHFDTGPRSWVGQNHCFKACDWSVDSDLSLHWLTKDYTRINIIFDFCYLFPFRHWARLLHNI